MVKLIKEHYDKDDSDTSKAFTEGMDFIQHKASQYKYLINVYFQKFSVWTSKDIWLRNGGDIKNKSPLRIYLRVVKITFLV